MLSLFTRLRRITSGATWIPEIDGLRFVAILSVVLYHIGGEVLSKAGHGWTTQVWYQPAMKLVSNGSRGVELFFIHLRAIIFSVKSRFRSRVITCADSRAWSRRTS
jgi:hypothetical protein